VVKDVVGIAHRVAGEACGIFVHISADALMLVIGLRVGMAANT
jgi:hypothetical protein